MRTPLSKSSVSNLFRNFSALEYAREQLNLEIVLCVLLALLQILKVRRHEGRILHNWVKNI